MKAFFSLSPTLKFLSVFALFLLAGFNAEAQYAHVTNNTCENMDIEVFETPTCAIPTVLSPVTASPGTTDIALSSLSNYAVGAYVTTTSASGTGPVTMQTPNCVCTSGASIDTETFIVYAGSCYTVDQKVEVIAECIGQDVYITINEI